MEARIQPLVHVSAAVFDDGKLLMVQEGKPAAMKRWNLPGGHVEVGESVLDAARRELREETGLLSPLNALVGIYSGPKSIRFVFSASAGDAIPFAGDEILAVRRVSLAEARAMPDETIISPAMLRRILDDLERGASHSLEPFVSIDI